MPKTEKAIKMANILDDVWRDLEMILDRKDIKESVMLNPQKVFVVHGHDEAILYSVSSFLQKIDMEPIILKDQPNKGLSVIEKFENEAKNAGFCISIFSPDDVGRVDNKEDKLQKRARQNVIFELGYFTGLLGRDRTCVLYKDGVEIPSDYNGVIYIKFDSEGAWKTTLAREMRVAGMNMNIDKLF
ncbi:hypothetical protein SDC9_172130 [bioreactor metagenome]|uniref:CD-NTase-associated protein 12/Pycsar effector protein TIR domain-containing protein n=2 Tax=root TaxID=1 RepID=A0A645GCV2_9ZZZZ